MPAGERTPSRSKHQQQGGKKPLERDRAALMLKLGNVKPASPPGSTSPIARRCRQPGHSAASPDQPCRMRSKRCGVVARPTPQVKNRQEEDRPPPNPKGRAG